MRILVCERTCGAMLSGWEGAKGQRRQNKDLRQPVGEPNTPMTWRIVVETSCDQYTTNDSYE